jgi:hypothetical protein
MHVSGCAVTLLYFLLYVTDQAGAATGCKGRAALGRRPPADERDPASVVACLHSFRQGKEDPQGKEDDQHAREESGQAGQHDTDDREQCASKQECRPPASPHDPCELHNTDDREQRASAEPPTDPPAACPPGEPVISGPTGWGGGRAPYDKVSAMRPHSHGRTLRRRRHPPSQSGCICKCIPWGLAAEWHRTYRGPRPDLARALEFYDRWLPGTMRRITDITGACRPQCVLLRGPGDRVARPGYR